MAKAGKKGVLL